MNTCDYKQLSPRERQVLQGVWDGLTVKAIGRRLKIEARTVEFHKADFPGTHR